MTKKTLSTGLLAAVLGGAFVALAPAASATPAPRPTSCAEVLDLDATSTDGECDLLLDGGLVSTYCADRASGTPTEYLSLDVANTASVASGYNFPGTTVTTTYTKVRLLLSDATHPGLALAGDRRFSSSTGSLNNGSITS
jgi:hypothetical protein